MTLSLAAWAVPVQSSSDEKQIRAGNDDRRAILMRELHMTPRALRALGKSICVDRVGGKSMKRLKGI